MRIRVPGAGIFWPGIRDKQPGSAALKDKKTVFSHFTNLRNYPILLIFSPFLPDLRILIKGSAEAITSDEDEVLEMNFFSLFTSNPDCSNVQEWTCPTCSNWVMNSTVNSRCWTQYRQTHREKLNFPTWQRPIFGREIFAKFELCKLNFFLLKNDISYRYKEFIPTDPGTITV
jgi:hypothetical protein